MPHQRYETKQSNQKQRLLSHRRYDTDRDRIVNQQIEHTNPIQTTLSLYLSLDRSTTALHPIQRRLGTAKDEDGPANTVALQRTTTSDGLRGQTRSPPRTPLARPHNLTNVRYACGRQKAHHNPARNHSSSLLSAGRQAGAWEGRRGRRCNAVNAQDYHNSRLNASQTKNGGANERSCSDATDIPSHPIPSPSPLRDDAVLLALFLLDLPLVSL